MKRNSGLTLIELIITIAIAATLLSLAIPGFGALISETKISTVTNDLVASINLTRSEAVKRGTRATLCASRPPYTACTETSDWSHGWIIFEDRNAFGTREEDEPIIHTHPAVENPITIRGKPTIANYLSYNSTGLSRLPNGGFQAGRIEICDGRDNTRARSIVINRLGRPRTNSGATECTRKPD